MKNIAVIHLAPLPGAPRAKTPIKSLDYAGSRAIEEAKLFENEGFDALLVENFGDAPFFSTRVPAETIASLAIIVSAMREAVNLPIGINVLRNDVRSALGIGAVCGCDFLRANVLSGVVATDQGIIEGQAATILRARERLQSSIKIYADAWVKHGVTLSAKNGSQVVSNLCTRSLADGIIITGEKTGGPVDLELLKDARKITKQSGLPLFVGSGLTPENYREYKKWADGFIVGSSLRKNGIAGAEVDKKRVKEWAKSRNAK